MKICPKCGGETPDVLSLCRHCKTRLPKTITQESKKNNPKRKLTTSEKWIFAFIFIGIFAIVVILMANDVLPKKTPAWFTALIPIVCGITLARMKKK